MLTNQNLKNNSIILNSITGDKPVILRWKLGETIFSQSKPKFFDELKSGLNFDDEFYLKTNLLLDQESMLLESKMTTLELSYADINDPEMLMQLSKPLKME